MEYVDYAKYPEAKKSVEEQLEEFGIKTDEELLDLYNGYPVLYWANLAWYEALEKYVYDNILVKPDITLEDRTDVWLANKRYELTQQLSANSKVEKALQSEKADIDLELMRRFEERGTTGTQTPNFTLTLKEDVKYPEIYDRTEFEEYVLESRKIHLLQKRLSSSGIQEELNALQLEYTNYLELLETSSDKEEIARQIYKTLFCNDDEELLEMKLNILKQTDSLETTLKQELQEFFTIPGVKLVTKTSINSRKRS